MAAPARRRCGCTWARSDPSASSPPTTRTSPPRPIRSSTTTQTLLDASDLVFIDAPATGFSRIAGKDKEKAFFGVDPDGQAFANFIQEFLAKYNRWNSPKYLFGESYGTPRSAVLVNDLETEYDIDFNGVILLSQILNFDLSVDRPEYNPGINLPYQLALPTYAATAWYHNKLPGKKPADLVAFVQSVEHFAMGEYAQALQSGAGLPPKRRLAIANKLHEFTGLAGLVHHESRSAHRRRRVREDAAGRYGTDDRAVSTRASPASRSIRSARNPITIRNRRRSARPMSRRSTTMCATA